MAALLAITAYTLYRTTKSLKSFEIKDVDISQLDEIKILFDDEDEYEEILTSLYNYALDLAP